MKFIWGYYHGAEQRRSGQIVLNKADNNSAILRFKHNLKRRYLKHFFKKQIVLCNTTIYEKYKIKMILYTLYLLLHYYNWDKQLLFVYLLSFLWMNQTKSTGNKAYLISEKVLFLSLQTFPSSSEMCCPFKNVSQKIVLYADNHNDSGNDLHYCFRFYCSYITSKYLLISIFTSSNKVGGGVYFQMKYVWKV